MNTDEYVTSPDGFRLPRKPIQRIVIDVEPGNEVSVEPGYVGYIGTQGRVIAVGKPGELPQATPEAPHA